MSTVLAVALDWSSPVGLGAFLFGVGVWLYGLSHWAGLFRRRRE